MPKTSAKRPPTNKKSEVTSSVKKGDKVEWNTSQGKTRGTVKKKVSKPTQTKGHEAKP
jgi:hypothetical protein